MNSVVFAYAFLKAAHSNLSEKSNPLDSLEPLVKRALLDLKAGPVDLAKVRNQIKKRFGFSIPFNVIRYTFPRIKNSCDLIKLDQNTHKYIRSPGIHNLNEIRRLEEKSIEQYNRIKGHISNIIASEHIYSFQDMDSDEILEEWLDNCSISLLGSTPFFTPNNRDAEINRVIALAINDPVDGEAFLSDLTDIAMGDALYRAIKTITEHDAVSSGSEAEALEELDKSTQSFSSKMKNVDVYFDTRIILRVLGIAPEEMTVAAKELTSLCQSLDAKLCVFEHTIHEILRIVDSVISRLNMKGAMISGDFADHMINNGWNDADLLEFKVNLEETLIELGFSILPSPKVIPELSVRESKFYDRLNIQFNKNTDDAIQADVDSITAIYRIRKGEGKRYLEKCDAIFITQNKGLADTSTTFFKKEFKSDNIYNRVQHCMTDVVFSTRLWTKLPTSISTLPRSHIISHAFGNLFLNPEVKESFLQRLNDMLGDEKISDSEYNTIRLSRFTDELLALKYNNLDSTLSEKEAENVCSKVLNLQKKRFDELKREIIIKQSKKEYELKSELDNTTNILNETTELLYHEVEELKKSNQNLSDELENKVNHIKEQNASILYWEMKKEKIKSKLSKYLKHTSSLCILLFSYVIFNNIFEEYGLLDSFISKENLTSYNQNINSINNVINIFLCFLTLFGSSIFGVKSWLENRIQQIIFRIFIE